MSDTTPGTQQCKLQRGAADPVPTRTDGVFENWPGNIKFTAPLYLRPKTLAELANAILQAESAGHQVRAYGSKWSFSDAVCAGQWPARPGAMIVTEQLKKSLHQSDLPWILAAGVDPTFLFHVEAGIKLDDLNGRLHERGEAVEAGGGSGQSLAGLMSTSTHSGDSDVAPLVDYVRAIHLVGAGGIEHWIEPDSRITDPAKLQAFYPCLAAGNIHYNTRLFNAVLVSAGSMGVIYSVVLKTVPQYGLHQHRVATTWEALLETDPNLTKVLDGSYLASMRGRINVHDDTIILMDPPFTPNCFSQIVINPYPLYGNDGNLTRQQLLHVGKHLCFVTNRVKIPIPPNPGNPPDGPTLESMGQQLGQTARNSLGGNILDGPRYDLEFFLFAESQKAEPDVSKKAAALVDFLANNYQPGTISAVINFVLKNILPVEERFNVSHKLSEVVVWDDKIRSFCMEAAFTVPDALAFVPKVLALVASYAARNPQIYIGGYLALRFVGKKTDALLGMQRWSPTCCVEYLGLAGSRGVDEFVDDLQKLAIASGGILHLGLQNNVMTAADLRNAYGPANIEAFRRTRGILSQNGTLATFDNSFTDRLGLSALERKRTDISFLAPLLLSDPEIPVLKRTDISFLTPLLLAGPG